MPAWPIASESEEAAWAAGFLDGDGCISYSESRRYSVVSIAQTDREALDRFRRALGGGAVRGPYQAERAGQWAKKAQYRYSVAERRVVLRIVQRLWPWLTSIRQAQAARALSPFGVRVDELRSFERVRHGDWRNHLAWCAGFFDADGNFGLTTASRYPSACITQVAREPLDRFHRIVGVGTVYGPNDSRIQDGWSRRPIYYYRCHGFLQMQALAAMLWFKLGSAKRSQARAVLSQWQRTCRKGHPKKPNHKGCGPCTAEYWRSKRMGRRITHSSSG